MKKAKVPRDSSQRARKTLDPFTGDVEAEPMKDPAAVELGRKGGLKGGKARAAKLSPEERSAIARKAAQARWATK
jgi:hypothetical protein